MSNNFTELKQHFKVLRNDFSERRNTIPRPDEREMIGYPEAIAALLDGLPIESARKILTAAISIIETSNTVKADEIYKKFGSCTS